VRAFANVINTSVLDKLDELEHGTVLQKFVATGGDFSKGDSMIVEVHGFVSDTGEFFITNERFERSKEQE
jgi:hypothetical protein